MHHLSHQLITPPRLAADGRGFAFVGQFRVIMQLDASSDWTKFEYRQYIKGTCLIYRGRFASFPHSRANWTPIGAPLHAGHLFKVPGGLKESFTEDGEVLNGVITRFGYRSNRPVVSLGLQDHYLPTQRTGRIYHSLDTFGIRGERVEPGLRIVYNISYEGRIIDTSRSASGSQTVLRRHWNFSADDIIG